MPLLICLSCMGLIAGTGNDKEIIYSSPKNGFIMLGGIPYNAHEPMTCIANLRARLEQIERKLWERPFDGRGITRKEGRKQAR